jgi:hypothetical protein
MAASSSNNLSSSKLRRVRASHTKQKLFEAAHKDEALIIVASQLAMLTTSVDSLGHLLMSSLEGHLPCQSANQCHSHIPSCWPAAFEEVDVEVECEGEGEDALAAHCTRAGQHLVVAPDPVEGNVAEDCSISFKGTWQRLDPWLFLDAVELASVSQTCTGSCNLVSVSTPFFNGGPKVFGERTAAAAVQAEPQTKCADTCVIMGGPSALDSVPVYTREELANVCDALVEPLANAIHGCMDAGSLLARSRPEVEQFSLGCLLRDICSKVVPLTVVLEQRRQTIDTYSEKLQELHAQRKALKISHTSD